MGMKSILIVDDEEILRITVKKELERQGYDVACASSVDEAMVFVREKFYHLILSDLRMEGKTGLELLAEAKKVHPDTMVIIITAYGSLDTAISALQAGASDYILKPCDRHELVFRVKNCLEKQEFQRKVKLYENILPVCSVCSMIRDDSGKEPGEGDWMDLSEYLAEKSGVDVSHGYCPTCYEREMEKIRNMDTE